MKIHGLDGKIIDVPRGAFETMYRPFGCKSVVEVSAELPQDEHPPQGEPPLGEPALEGRPTARRRAAE